MTEPKLARTQQTARRAGVAGRAVGTTLLALALAACGGADDDGQQGAGGAGTGLVPGGQGPGASGPGGVPGGPGGPGNYNLANFSAQPQSRWARLSVPSAIADTLPAECAIERADGTRVLAVKGRPNGEMARIFHVQADLGGYGTDNGTLEPVGPMQQQTFAKSDWILDEPEKMEVVLHAERSGQRWSMPFEHDAIVESSPYVQVERYFAGPEQGVWGEMFLTFYRHQDVVDVEGRFGWSDPNDLEWWTNFDSIELTMGEELVLYFAKPSGYGPIVGGWQLFREQAEHGTQFPHGMAPHFYGVILPRPQAPQSTPAEQEREARLEAAREGPVLAVGDHTVWDGHWFALGETPTIPASVDAAAAADQRAEAFRILLNTPGGVWDERPLANPYSTGQTGGQEPFGATKGTLAVTYGDPRFVWEMLYSSTDYGLRTFHYRELDGSRVLAANHPDWVARGGVADERFGDDLLGKSPGPVWGWNLGRHGPDGQHRGQNYMWATLALTGSWILTEVALDLVETDATARGPSLHPTAPRGLRMQQDLAKIYGLLPGENDRDKVLMVMQWALESWENGWAGGSASGPVKPLEAAAADARVLCCDHDFFVPWNESVGVIGLLESRALMRNLGHTDRQLRYEALITEASRTHLLYGTTRDASGALIPLNGVWWLPDGQPQPASYYDVNRPGASTNPGEGIDMLLGTPGWFWWWSGVVYGTLFFARTDSPEFQIAQEIQLTYLQPDSIKNAEWIALGTP